MEAPFTLATLMDLSGSGRSLASAIQSRWRKPLGRSRESCSAKHCNVVKFLTVVSYIVCLVLSSHPTI
jgi:hypothetical protein